MIGAGRRDKKITIQRMVQATTDEGEITETPLNIATVWAAIEPLDAREAWQAKQSQATTTHRITTLYMIGITSRMRAVWGDRIFNFESVVNEKEANRELVIMATEVTA